MRESLAALRGVVGIGLSIFVGLWGSAIFGFASLRPMLIDSKVYSTMCTPVEAAAGTVCTPQAKKLSEMFTFASNFQLFMSFISGPLMDITSPRLMAVVAGLVTAAAWAILALGLELGLDVAVTIGFSLLGLSSAMFVPSYLAPLFLRRCNVAVSHLKRGGRCHGCCSCSAARVAFGETVVMSAVATAWCCGPVIFLAASYVEAAGVSLFVQALVFCGISVVIAALAFITLFSRVEMVAFASDAAAASLNDADAGAAAAADGVAKDDAADSGGGEESCDDEGAVQRDGEAAAALGSAGGGDGDGGSADLEESAAGPATAVGDDGWGYTSLPKRRAAGGGRLSSLDASSSKQSRCCRALRVWFAAKLPRGMRLFDQCDTALCFAYLLLIPTIAFSAIQGNFLIEHVATLFDAIELEEMKSSADGMTSRSVTSTATLLDAFNWCFPLGCCCSSLAIGPLLTAVERGGARAIWIPFFICSVMIMLVTALSMIPSLDAQWATCIIFPFAYVFPWTIGPEFIRRFFPPSSFGTLFGLNMGCAGVIGLIVLPLLTELALSLDGDDTIDADEAVTFRIASGVVIIISGLLPLIFPFYLACSCKKLERALDANVFRADGGKKQGDPSLSFATTSFTVDRSVPGSLLAQRKQSSDVAEYGAADDSGALANGSSRVGEPGGSGGSTSVHVPAASAGLRFAVVGEGGSSLVDSAVARIRESFSQRRVFGATGAAGDNEETMELGSYRGSAPTAALL